MKFLESSRGVTDFTPRGPARPGPGRAFPGRAEISRDGKFLKVDLNIGGLGPHQRYSGELMLTP